MTGLQTTLHHVGGNKADAMPGLCQITWLITCNCKINIAVYVNLSFNLFDGLLFSFTLSIYFVLKVAVPCQSYT